MAASEQSSSQNLVLTDRPLSGIPYGRFGSGARTHRSRKLPVAGKYPQGQLTARLLTDSEPSANGGKGRTVAIMKLSSMAGFSRKLAIDFSSNPRAAKGRFRPTPCDLAASAWIRKIARQSKVTECNPLMHNTRFIFDACVETTQTPRNQHEQKRIDRCRSRQDRPN